MHVTEPTKPRTPTIADVEARLAELIELTKTVAENSTPRITRKAMTTRQKVEVIERDGPEHYLGLPYE